MRLPPSVWIGLLGDARTVAAYHVRVHRRGPGEHWFWLGPISDSGSARLRVPAAMGNRVIAAPVLGWQLSRGLIRPGRDGRLPVIRHTCDESACCNPSHWLPGTREDNAADYKARKDDPFSPWPTSAARQAGRVPSVTPSCKHWQKAPTRRRQTRPSSTR